MKVDFVIYWSCIVDTASIKYGTPSAFCQDWSKILVVCKAVFIGFILVKGWVKLYEDCRYEAKSRGASKYNITEFVDKFIV